MRVSFVPALLLCAVVATSAQQKMERPGISNYTKVDAVVACGGATETSALAGLKADGFKTIINLRQPTESGANIEQNAAEAKAQLTRKAACVIHQQHPAIGLLRKEAGNNVMWPRSIS